MSAVNRKSRSLVDPAIVVTATVAGKEPEVLKGVEAYIAAIHNMEHHLRAYRHGGFTYGNFDDNSGSLTFMQVCATERENQVIPLLSEGTQTFTFKDRKITAITVTEQQQVLSEEHYVMKMAKVRDHIRVDKVLPASSSWSCVVM